jgi:hypothetical protein
MAPASGAGAADPVVGRLPDPTKSVYDTAKQGIGPYPICTLNDYRRAPERKRAKARMEELVQHIVQGEVTSLLGRGARLTLGE